jgi:hypothetical protein
VTGSCRLCDNRGWLGRRDRLAVAEPEHVRPHASDLFLAHPGLASCPLDQSPVLDKHSLRVAARGHSLAAGIARRSARPPEDDDADDADEGCREDEQQQAGRGAHSSLYRQQERLAKAQESRPFLKQARYARRVDEQRLTRKSILRLAGLAAASVGIGSWQTRAAQGGGPAAVESGAVSCVLTPELTEGPYYIANEKLRRNITDGHPGTPLVLQLAVVNASTCKPMRGATVDIWHADAAGNYSAVNCSFRTR